MNEYILPFIMCLINMLAGVYLGRKYERLKNLDTWPDEMKIDDDGLNAILLIEPPEHSGSIEKIILIEHRKDRGDNLKTFIEDWRV